MTEKTIESSLSCKEIKSSILKELNSEYLLEGLMLKLTLQYSAYLMQRTDSLKKTLMLEKIEGRKRRSFLEKEMAAHSSVLAWRIPGMEEPGGHPSMGSHRVGHD